MKKISLIFAASLGTVFEFFDFILFIVLMPVLAPLFFPSSDPHLSLLVGYGAFAVSFLMRPLGGYFFGAVGDRYGRGVSLSWSMGVMGASTLAMGCLPTHEVMGVWAPVLLVLFRLLQGFSAGGEYSGAALVLLEAAPKTHFFRRGSFIPMAAVLAAILTGQVVTHLGLSSEGALAGWRIPFFIGGFVGFLGFFVRKALFLDSGPTEERVKESLFQRKYAWGLVFMSLLSGLGVMVYYTFTSYLITFLTLYGGWSKTFAYQTSTLISVGAFLCMYPISWVADRFIPAKILLKQVTLMLALVSVPLFYLLSLESEGIISALIPLMSLLFGFFVLTNGMAAVLFSEAVRFRGMATSYTLGASLLGGTAPLVYTFIAQFFDYEWSAGVYLAAISFVCWLFFMRKSPLT